MKRLLSLVAFASVVGLAGAALTAPFGVRLSFVDGSPAERIAVTWNTEDPAASVVEYGETDALGMRIEGSSFMAQSEIKYIHEVVLDGLTAGTVYHYRVGQEDDFSPVYQLHSAPVEDPSSGAFSFAVLGDGRAGLTGEGPSEHWPTILDETAQTQPDFILHSGDLVADGNGPREWRYWIDASQAVSPLIPIMPAIGNHDTGLDGGDAEHYTDVFALPHNDVTRTEDYYYFTYSNALFISLSTWTFKGGTTPFAEQAAWLDRVLAENPKKWKFVFFHHPTYTSVRNVPVLGDLWPANEMEQNPAFVPIFERHEVDFVLMGHHHFYERMGPVIHSDDWNVGTPDPDGVTYIITGGAGATPYTEAAAALICGEYRDPGSMACSGRFHYVHFSIEDHRLRMETWSTARQLFSDNEWNHILVDEVDVVKRPAELERDEGEAADAASEDAAEGEGSEARPADAETTEGDREDDGHEPELDTLEREPDGAPVADLDRAEREPDGVPGTEPERTEAEPDGADSGDTPPTGNDGTGNSDDCGCSARGTWPGGPIATVPALLALVWFTGRRRRRAGPA